MTRIHDMARKDYYSILSIPEDADAQAIREAFRRLALQYHPDRNPDDEKAEARFKEISEAHTVLSNPQQRDRYDQLTGRGPYRKPGGFGQDRHGKRITHSDPPSPRNQSYRQQRYANRGVRINEASELLAAFCTVSLMFGIIMLVATWGVYRQLFGSLLWPTVPGKTISEEISGGMNYEYNANGQRYTAYARYPVDDASGWDMDVPVGSPVTVHYDPSDPANAVLEPGIDPPAVFCLAANIVVLIPGTLMIVSVIRRRLRMSPGDWDGPFWPK